MHSPTLHRLCYGLLHHEWIVHSSIGIRAGPHFSSHHRQCLDLNPKSAYGLQYQHLYASQSSETSRRGVWYGAAPGLTPAADSELDDWHCWTIVFQISCLSFCFSADSNTSKSAQPLDGRFLTPNRQACECANNPNLKDATQNPYEDMGSRMAFYRKSECACLVDSSQNFSPDELL